MLTWNNKKLYQIDDEELETIDLDKIQQALDDKFLEKK